MGFRGFPVQISSRQRALLAGYNESGCSARPRKDDSLTGEGVGHLSPLIQQTLGKASRKIRHLHEFDQHRGLGIRGTGRQPESLERYATLSDKTPPPSTSM